MRRRSVTAVSAVVLAAALPGTAAAFPGQGSCAGEGAFVSSSAQEFGSFFGAIVAGTARASGGLHDVIAESHAVNCKPRP